MLTITSRDDDGSLTRETASDDRAEALPQSHQSFVIRRTQFRLLLALCDGFGNDPHAPREEEFEIDAFPVPDLGSITEAVRLAVLVHKVVVLS